jgi:hypothetical protein
MVTKQTAIDARLTELLPQVTLLQDSYLANYGRYFQGLTTHAALPNGETALPVDLASHPTHQSHTYADFWRGVYLGEPDEEAGEREELYKFGDEALNDVRSLAARIRFDTQCSLDGHSWTMTLEYEDGDGHFSKTVNKDGTSTEWGKVEAEEALE